MRALLLLAVVALAGCLEGLNPGGAPRSCAGLDAAEPSGNAPLAQVLRLPPREVAERLARAAGDIVTSDGRVQANVVNDEPTLTFRAARGVVEYWPADGGPFELVRYWGRDHFTPIGGQTAREDFGRLLAVFGLAPSELGAIRVDAQPRRLDGDARLRWEDEEIHSPDVRQNLGASFWQNQEADGVDGYRMQVTFAPTFDLSNARPTLKESTARSIAELALDCRLGTEGSAAGVVPSWGVVEESLAIAMPVAFNLGEACHEQRMRYVWVDAQTGAALRVGDEQGACIE